MTAVLLEIAPLTALATVFANVMKATVGILAVSVCLVTVDSSVRAVSLTTQKYAIAMTDICGKKTEKTNAYLVTVGSLVRALLLMAPKCANVWKDMPWKRT